MKITKLPSSRYQHLLRFSQSFLADQLSICRKTAKEWQPICSVKRRRYVNKAIDYREAIRTKQSQCN